MARSTLRDHLLPRQRPQLERELDLAIDALTRTRTHLSAGELTQAGLAFRAARSVLGGLWRQPLLDVDLTEPARK